MSIIADEVWKLSNKQRLINRHKWLLKQSRQRLQSLEQGHAYFDPAAQIRFKKESEEFAEEAKEVKKEIDKITREEKKKNG